MNPFDVLFTNPILNLLVAFYVLLASISTPGALGLAIILLTITVRMLLWPLTTAQLKSTQKLSALKPHLERLKKEHGHDKLRHQQEITKLYQEHGVNPLAGCLPILIQIPVFFALYNVLIKIISPSSDFLTTLNSKLYFSFLHLDKIPDPNFLGLSLAAKPSQWQQLGILILTIPVITGLLQLIQSKMMAPASPPASPNRGESQGGPALPSSAVIRPPQKPELEDTMAQMQSQMVYLMPAMIAFLSYSFPIGLTLYWNAFTIIGIIQQYLISGPGALAKYLPQTFRK